MPRPSPKPRDDDYAWLPAVADIDDELARRSHAAKAQHASDRQVEKDLFSRGWVKIYVQSGPLQGVSGWAPKDSLAWYTAHKGSVVITDDGSGRP